MTSRYASQSDPDVHGQEIMFHDSQFYDAQAGNYQVELYLYNIALLHTPCRLGRGWKTKKGGPGHSAFERPDPLCFGFLLAERHEDLQ